MWSSSQVWLSIVRVGVASALLSWPAAASAGVPGTWSDAGDMVQARSDFTLTALAGGGAIAIGGQSQVALPHGWRTVTVATAETFNPATGLWSATSALSAPRTRHRAVRLGDGRVLVVGGLDGANPTPLRSTELFDPVTRRFSAGPPLLVGRYDLSLLLLRDGRAMVIGGCVSYGCGAGTNVVELFDPSTNQWTLAAPLLTARAGETATLLPSGQVVVTSGDTAGWDSTERYDPVQDAWSDAGWLTTGRAGHAAVALDTGEVLIAGGIDQWGAILSAAETGEVVSGVWNPTQDMHDPRQYHELMALPGGRALAIGGQRVVGHLFVTIGRCELFDPATRTWTATGTMAVARDGHRAVLLEGGDVLVTGGNDGAAGLFTARSERYTPDIAALRFLDSFEAPTERSPEAGGWRAIAGTSNPNAVAASFIQNDQQNVSKLTPVDDAGSAFGSPHLFLENDGAATDATTFGRGDALIFTDRFRATHNASVIDVRGGTLAVDYSNGDASRSGPALQLALQLADGRWFVHEPLLAGNTTSAVTHATLTPGGIGLTSLFIPLTVSPGAADAGARLVLDPAARRALSAAELAHVAALGIYTNPAPDDPSPTRVDNFELSGFAIGCVPGLAQSLTIDPTPGAGATINWSAAARAGAYDIVRGSLSALTFATGGLSAAVDRCLANDLTTLSIDDVDLPAPGDGYFYLVRGAGCESGSFDDASAGRQALRDPQLIGNSATCQ